MSIVIRKHEILDLVSRIDCITAIEKGFISYSNGHTVIPPVAELLFNNPKGEAHIKYGYIKNDDYYVIKIASGFYENKNLGISSSQGLMLVFNQKTGEVVGVLLDEGYLTDIRTAAAGAVVAKYFAPKNISAVGIIGTGIQAKLQLQYMQQHNPCKTVWIWGRNVNNCEKFKADLGNEFDIIIAKTPAEVAQNCNMILTTTPSENALLQTTDILPGTHITAVGSDTAEKQELDGGILQIAELVIADSLPQSKSRGECYRAVKGGFIQENKIIELGKALQNQSLQRKNESQITIADLTGVAIQDIMIAQNVYLEYIKNRK